MHNVLERCFTCDMIDLLTDLLHLSNPFIWDVALEGSCQSRQQVEMQLTSFWNRACVFWVGRHTLYESFSSWQTFKTPWLHIVLTLCWAMQRLTFDEGLLKLGKNKSVCVTLQAE